MAVGPLVHEVQFTRFSVIEKEKISFLVHHRDYRFLNVEMRYLVRYLLEHVDSALDVDTLRLDDLLGGSRFKAVLLRVMVIVDQLLLELFI